ncbi:MAG: hypothetical protein FJ146_13260 [Deltaproteobacteria bacterium]|nr:hypothetical protein [Deltaproteobacteria bacterium]
MTKSFKISASVRRMYAPGMTSAKPIFAAFAALVLGVNSASCRKQTISVNGQSVGSTIDKLKAKNAKNVPNGPSGTPIELPNALVANRSHYQTRSVVTLKIESSEVSPGAPIRLMSETTLRDLLTGVAGSLGLAAPEDPATPGWETHFLSDDNGFVIRLYPSDPAIASAMSYGENSLKLLVDESTSPKMAVSKVYLQDFPYVTMSFSSFDTSMQQQGGFQGSVDYVTGTTITNGTYQMTTGSVGLPNW